MSVSVNGPWCWLRLPVLWCAVFVYCAVIFTLSSIPARYHAGGGVWEYDKLAHGLLYGGLGWVLWQALRVGRRNANGFFIAVAAIVLAGLYGASDEWHQSFVPGRSPSLMDLLADVVGATTSVSMSVFLTRRSRQKR